jgi:trimethylamine--corrinoid protein Co-methyltransferase
MTTHTSRRSGGRSARRSARAAPLPDHLKPVRAGMSGGTLSPLSASGMDQMHHAALDALETIGLSQAPNTGAAAMTAAGAILGDDGRMRFPRALVEDTIAKANRSITLRARDPKHDMVLSGTRVHYGTAGAAVHVVDVDGRHYRDSTLQDLHDAARIADVLDNLHFVQRPMVARDILDNHEMDLNTIYACCAGTRKHVGVSFTEPGFVPGALDMLHLLAGSEEEWRERPFVSNSNCFVVPPMKFAAESCQVMEACIDGGMPILLLSAG